MFMLLRKIPKTKIIFSQYVRFGDDTILQTQLHYLILIIIHLNTVNHTRKLFHKSKVSQD